MKGKIIFVLMMFIIVSSVHAQSSVKVIVNTSNTTSSISKAEVANLFLKKVTKWENGSKVVPVDQTVESAARVSFTKSVLGREVTAVKSYWQQKLFSGEATPPTEKSSDAEIVNFVKANPGAVGYVSGNAQVAGVKVLKITE